MGPPKRLAFLALPHSQGFTGQAGMTLPHELVDPSGGASPPCKLEVPLGLTLSQTQIPHKEMVARFSLLF